MFNSMMSRSMIVIRASIEFYTFIRDLVEMLDDGSQRVTVSNNERLFAFEHRAGNMVVPEGKNSNNGILQAFSGREDVLGEFLVAGVVVGVSKKFI